MNRDLDLIEHNQNYPDPFFHAQHCHEAMLTFAYALNATIRGQCPVLYSNLVCIDLHCVELETNMELNRDAAMMAGLSDGTKFKMENFSYSNPVIVREMFRHLQNTSFLGLTVSWGLYCMTLCFSKSWKSQIS